MFLSKYGVARHIYIPIVKRAVVDFAVSADWTPAAGDVKISKDGGAAANVTNLPTAITMGNGAMWDFSITATEMQAAQVVITVVDAATKAVEDQSIIIETYGNASAEHAVDLSDSVRAGLTALPNAAAEAAGGLYTRGSGAGQINQDANGRVDANTKAWLGGTIPAVNVTGVPLVDAKYLLGTIFSTPATAGIIDVNLKNIANVAVSTSTAQLGVNAVNIGGTAQTGRDLGASVLLSAGTGTGQLDFTSGVVKANQTQLLGGIIPAPNVTGVPLVDAKYLLGTIFSTPATAGILDVNVKNWSNTAVVLSAGLPSVKGTTGGGTIG